MWGSLEIRLTMSTPRRPLDSAAPGPRTGSPEAPQVGVWGIPGAYDETANPPVARLLGRLGFAVLSARLLDPSVTRVATRLRTSRASVLRVLRRIRRMVSEALESSGCSPG